MRKVSFEGGRRVDRFDSVQASVRGISNQVHQAVAIRIDAGGVLGRHPAASAQLFVVVDGSGWVSGGDGRREPISAGEAVAWDEGEQHESGSKSGMTAVVVEAEQLGL